MKDENRTKEEEEESYKQILLTIMLIVWDRYHE